MSSPEVKASYHNQKICATQLNTPCPEGQGFTDCTDKKTKPTGGRFCFCQKFTFYIGFYLIPDMSGMHGISH